jgi:hypothetical protein
LKNSKPTEEQILKVKQYLECVLIASKRHKEIFLKIAMLEEKKYKLKNSEISENNSHQSTTNYSLETIIDNINTLQNEAEAIKLQLANALTIFSYLEDSTQQRLLKMRYILLRKWNEIANELNYSINGIKYFQDKAIKKIASYF